MRCPWFYGHGGVDRWHERRGMKRKIEEGCENKKIRLTEGDMQRPVGEGECQNESPKRGSLKRKIEVKSGNKRRRMNSGNEVAGKVNDGTEAKVAGEVNSGDEVAGKVNDCTEAEAAGNVNVDNEVKGEVNDKEATEKWKKMGAYGKKENCVVVSIKEKGDVGEARGSAESNCTAEQRGENAAAKATCLRERANPTAARKRRRPNKVERTW